MRQRTILITGASGEIGNCLIPRLAEQLATLLVTLDLTPLDHRLSRYVAREVTGSVLDRDQLGLLSAKHEVTTIFHLAALLSSRAEYDFYRAVPPGGYKKGLAASERTDVGDGDIPPETLGEDFFVYKPYHLEASTRYHDLAKATNMIQKALDSGQYDGALWFEATPYVEETIYWLNLLIDTRVPIVGNVAHRLHRALSADGPRNIVDAVDNSDRMAVGPERAGLGVRMDFGADDTKVAGEVVGQVFQYTAAAVVEHDLGPIAGIF